MRVRDETSRQIARDAASRIIDLHVARRLRWTCRAGIAVAPIRTETVDGVGRGVRAEDVVQLGLKPVQVRSVPKVINI